MFNNTKLFCLAAIIMLFITSGLTISAQTSAFTYQGRFTDTSVGQQPTNGTYSMTFRLYDALSGGSQIGSSITSTVTVTSGVFTARLDFGAAAFNTSGARYLEVQVGSTVLAPRQEITSTPFATRAVNAAAADSLSAGCIGCVTNQQINSIDGSKVTGTVANATTAQSATIAQSAATATTATTAGNVTGVVAVANGGTGSSTQNFVDLTTNQTVAGNKTFTGTLSGAGISNLNRVFVFNGTLPLSIAGSASAYVFAGPTASVTLAANQRMTAAATAALGKTSADVQLAQVGVCYQSSGGAITNFVGTNYILVQFSATRQTYSATASVTGLAAGTYTVGYCVQNSGTTAINNNDYVNGWVMVTNN